MTEIINAGTDLLDVFIGRQNIDNDSIRLNDDDISFDLCARDSDDDAGKTIRRSTMDDVENFFADTLQSHPFAKHLLLLLWIREVEFSMGALRDEDVYDFIQKGAFAFYSIDLDDETVEHEFLELLDEGYLRETNSGFFLESKGKRVAEKLHKSDFCLDGMIGKLRETVAVLEKRLSLLTEPTSQPKKKFTKSAKTRNTPTQKDHKKKILNYIGRFLELCRQNVKVNKADLAKECGLRPEVVSRKESKYYALVKEAEDEIKRPNFFHDPDAVVEYFFDIQRRLDVD